MSHITLGQQGLAAADAKRWDEAISKLSKALQSSPTPAWLVARSKALVGVGRFREALDDADLAWHKAYDRSRRPLMIDAQYRRAVAYFRLGELGNADCCCVYAMRLIKGEPAVEKQDPKALWTDDGGFWTATLEDAKKEAQMDSMNQGGDGGMGVAMGGQQPPHVKEWRAASTLRTQILFALDKLAADDDKRKMTTSLKPQAKELSDLAASSVTEDKPAPTASTSSAGRPPVSKDEPLRIQDFQTNTTMSISIFTKGVDKNKLQVEFLPQKVRLIPIVYPNGEEKGAAFELWAEIDPAASKYTLTPNKVELSLAKKTPGKWKQMFTDASMKASAPSAEENEALSELREARNKAMAAASAQDISSATATATSSAEPSRASNSSKPAYPSSSAKGPKDWDSIGAEADNSDDDEGRDVNFFFKKLFKNATPEQQRAMMKSFTESNGTSLSTDWDDVKARTVDTVPPEGVEAKKWD